MAFIKTEVRDELDRSLARFPVIKEIMDRMDKVEVIQLGLDSRCDDMARKEVGYTDEICQSVSRLESRVHSLSNEPSTELKLSSSMPGKLDQIGRETK